MRPVLRQMNLVARDMTATLAFYRRLGLDIPEEAVWSSGGKAHHVVVDMPDGFQIEFDSPELTRAYDPGWEDSIGGNPNFLVFTLPSREAVDETYADLTAAGHLGHLEPFDAFWGARYGIVDDPNGNHVGLISESDPERRSAPPEL